MAAPGTSRPGPAERAASARRELGLALGLCLLASAGALVAAGRAWAVGTVPALPPLPAQDLAVTGAQAGTPVRGLAVVGLAGAVAVLAARGWLRPVVGVLILLAGLGVGLAALSFDPGSALSASRPAGAGLTGVAGTAWPLLTTACGAALAAAGALVAVRGRRWSTMSRRYDSPAAAPGAPEQAGAGPGAGPSGERELWEALDRGEDPTEQVAPDPAPAGPALPPAPPTGGSGSPPG